MRACETVLAMQARLLDLNAEWKAEAEAEGRPHIPVNIGVGLNTGQATVGNFGSTQRLQYSCLGDEVNLASRLEGLCKAYARRHHRRREHLAAGGGLRRCRARPRHGEGQDRAGTHLRADRPAGDDQAARVPDAARPAGRLPPPLSHRRLRRGLAGDPGVRRGSAGIGLATRAITRSCGSGSIT